MSSSTVHFRIKAVADTAQARAEINRLGREVQALNTNKRNALNIISGSSLDTRPIAKITDGVDKLTRAIDKGKISSRQWTETFKNRHEIIRRQSKLSTATLTSMNDKIRGIDSGVLTFERFDRSLGSFGGRLRDANAQMRLMASATNAWSRNVVDAGKNMQWAGRQITVGFGVPFAVLAGLSGREFLQMEKQLVRFEKVFNETFETSTKYASKQIHDLSKQLVTDLGRSAEESVEVAATFAQMGLELDAVKSLTRETMRLSTLGEIPIDTATDLLRGLRASYNLTNDELVTTVDLLNAIENSTSLTTANMAEALPQILPIFKQFNLSVGQGTAILAGMNEQLGNAEESTNALKVIMQRIFDPTQEAIDKFASVGIDLEAIVAKNEDDVLGFFSDLNIVLDENNVTAKQFAETFGNLLGLRQAGRGLTAIKSVGEALNGVENDYSRASAKIGEDAENAASATRELNAVLESTGGSLTRMVERMQVELASIGEKIMKMVTPIVGFVTRMLESFNSMSDYWQNATLAVLGFGAAIGALMMAGGILFNLFGSVTMALSKAAGMLRLTDTNATASALAMHKASVEAMELNMVTQQLGLGLIDLTTAQNTLAQSTNAATSALAKQAIAGREVQTNLAMANMKGRGLPVANPHAVGLGHGKTNKVVTPKDLKTTSRGPLMGIGLMLATVLPMMGVVESKTANIAANVAQIGFGILLLSNYSGGINKLFSGISKGLAGGLDAMKLLTKQGSSMNTTLTSMSSTLAKGGPMAVGIGAVVAAAAVGAVYFMRWRQRISDANNELLQSAKLVDDVLEGADIKKNAVEFGVDPDLNEAEKAGALMASKVVTGFTSSMSNIREAGGLGRMFSDEVQFKKLMFDLATRTDTTIDELKKIIFTAKHQIGLDFDIDFDNKEDLIRQLLGDQLSIIELAAKPIISGDTTLKPSAIESFTGNRISGAGEAVAQEYADRLLAVSNDPVMFKAVYNQIKHEMEEIEKNVNPAHFAALQNELVDRFASENSAFAGVEKEFSTLGEMLGRLADSSVEFDRILGDDAFDALAKSSKEFLESRARFLDETSNWTNRSQKGIDTQVAMDELQDQYKRMFDRNIALGMEIEDAHAEALQGLPDKVYDYLDSNSNIPSQFLDGPADEMTDILEDYALFLLEKERTRLKGIAHERSIRSQETSDLIANIENYEEAEKSNLEELADDSEDAAKEAAINIGNLRGAVEDAMSEYMDAVIESFEKQRDEIEESYDGPNGLITKIEEAKKAEEERDDQREENFRRELERLRMLSDEMSSKINLDAAIARGDTDSAAQIQQDLLFGSTEDAFERFSEMIKERADARDEYTENEVSRLEEERDLALEVHDEQMDAIEERLEELKKATPATLAEWNKMLEMVNAAVEEHGHTINADIAKIGRDGWKDAITNWEQDLLEDDRWSRIEQGMRDKAKSVGESFTGSLRDALLGGMSMEDFIVAATSGGTGADGEGGYVRGPDSGPLSNSNKPGTEAYYQYEQFLALRNKMASLMLPDGAAMPLPVDYFTENDGTRVLVFRTEDKMRMTNAANLAEMVRFLGTVIPDGLPEFRYSSSGGYTPTQTTDADMFHSGGHIGSSKAVNSKGEVPIVAQSGEYVLQRSAVNKIGIRALDMLNNGVQRFHDGGLVGGMNPFASSAGSMNPFGSSSGGLMGLIMSILSRLTGQLQGASGLSQLVPQADAAGNGDGTRGINPVPSGRIISRFGASRDGGRRSHLGIDIGAEKGAPIHAAWSGNVTKAGVGSGGFGNRVWIHSPSRGLYHAYAHLDSVGIGRGHVRQGQFIGTVGQTGNAATTPPHLHWSANPFGDNSEKGSFNPENILQLKKGGLIKMDNVLANLHKNEAVLRAPVATALESSIMNMDANRGGNLIVQIENMSGDKKDVQYLVKEVKKAYEQEMKAKGPTRRIG